MFVDTYFVPHRLTISIVQPLSAYQASHLLSLDGRQSPFLLVSLVSDLIYVQHLHLRRSELVRASF